MDCVTHSSIFMLPLLTWQRPEYGAFTSFRMFWHWWCHMSRMNEAELFHTEGMSDERFRQNPNREVDNFSRR